MKIKGLTISTITFDEYDGSINDLVDLVNKIQGSTSTLEFEKNHVTEYIANSSSEDSSGSAVLHSISAESAETDDDFDIEKVDSESELLSKLGDYTQLEYATGLMAGSYNTHQVQQLIQNEFYDKSSFTVPTKGEFCSFHRLREDADKSRVCKATDIADDGLRGLLFDLDFRQRALSYCSDDDIKIIQTEIETELVKIAEPSLLYFTGNGFHFGFLFERFVDKDRYKLLYDEITRVLEYIFDCNAKLKHLKVDKTKALIVKTQLRVLNSTNPKHDTTIKLADFDNWRIYENINAFISEISYSVEELKTCKADFFEKVESREYRYSSKKDFVLTPFHRKRASELLALFESNTLVQNNQLISQFTKACQYGNQVGWSFNCTFHDDEDPSAWIVFTLDWNGDIVIINGKCESDNCDADWTDLKGRLELLDELSGSDYSVRYTSKKKTVESKQTVSNIEEIPGIKNFQDPLVGSASDGAIIQGIFKIFEDFHSGALRATKKKKLGERQFAGYNFPSLFHEDATEKAYIYFERDKNGNLRIKGKDKELNWVNPEHRKQLFCALSEKLGLNKQRFLSFEEDIDNIQNDVVYNDDDEDDILF